MRVHYNWDAGDGIFLLMPLWEHNNVCSVGFPSRVTPRKIIDFVYSSSKSTFIQVYNGIGNGERNPLSANLCFSFQMINPALVCISQQCIIFGFSVLIFTRN